jgi:hypothetical protein
MLVLMLPLTSGDAVRAGRVYPAAVACKPKDRRIGTRAYQEGDADGEYPVAAIVDEVSFTVLGKKKHMVLPKWQVRGVILRVYLILHCLRWLLMRWYLYPPCWRKQEAPGAAGGVCAMIGCISFVLHCLQCRC